MANRAIKSAPQITPASEATYEAKTAKKKSWNRFIVIAAFSGVAIIACFVMFLWKQVGWFDWKASVNNELLGTLGDFVGGILGTLIAIYSIAMLVKTLNAQIDSNANMKVTNDNVIKTNNAQIKLDTQQLFDNKFQVFFDQYKDTISAYVADKGLNGRQALEAIVASFVATPFNNKLVYKKRVKASVREFEAFYAENREQLAVHFRELYQLMRLVAESDIDEEDRVLYAKCIRGQLSDGELVILRYNCLTANGIAMRRFVNHFNLLKHLPLMSLFEFRTWADMLPDKHMRSALDSAFITLRKIMKEVLNRRSDSRLRSLGRDYAKTLSPEEEVDAVERIRQYIDMHIQEDLSVEKLSQLAYMSQNHLTRTFKKKYGMTVIDYMIEHRLALAENLLKETNKTVTMIADEVGYFDYVYFSKLFKKRFGVTPREYRMMQKR